MISLRQGSLEDLDIICEFNRRMAEETEAVRLDVERLRRGVRRALEDPQRGRYFLAEEEGEVLGQLMITTEWSDWRDGWFWWLQSVYVRPEARGRGVFRCLFEHVETLARKSERVCGIRLYVESGNETAAQVYDQLGLPEADYRLRERDFIIDRT